MPTELDRRVDGVRRFNRFYTKRIGVLAENFLRSPYTLAEGRVLFELANRERPAPSDVAAALDLDPGYLSRILQRFERAGLVTRAASPADGRRIVLTLTAAGRAAYAPLNERSHDEIAALLAPLPDDRQEHVLNAMATIAQALGSDEPDNDIVLRDPGLGDYGWVIERHGVVYGAEYGFDARMEGFVSEVIAAYVANYRADLDRCWIAERNGVRCGCIFVVHDADTTTARLRLLLTEPAARGNGLGRRLVRECIAFARAAGYRKMILWTHSILTAARAIYASEGFVMTATESNDLWGPHLTSETWELSLQ
jgi:DNA-binding MarR family transcriptional regulator/predicted GNAT family N-acyltransferase